MTSQTKLYIEMTDMLALRCDCKECGASLSIPLTNTAGNSLLACPKCRKAWARQEGNNTYELALNDFGQKVQELKLLTPMIGFKLFIEIVSDRASSGKD